MRHLKIFPETRLGGCYFLEGVIYFNRADKGKPGESRGRKATDLSCVLSTSLLALDPRSRGRACINACCEVWFAIWWLRCRSAKWGPPFPAVLSALVIIFPFAPSSTGGFLFCPAPAGQNIPRSGRALTGFPGPGDFHIAGQISEGWASNSEPGPKDPISRAAEVGMKMQFDVH